MWNTVGQLNEVLSDVTFDRYTDEVKVDESVDVPKVLEDNQDVYMDDYQLKIEKVYDTEAAREEIVFDLGYVDDNCVILKLAQALDWKNGEPSDFGEAYMEITPEVARQIVYWLEGYLQENAKSQQPSQQNDLQHSLLHLL